MKNKDVFSPGEILRDQLSQQYEGSAWKSATSTINVCIKNEEMNEARRQAKEAIKNWEAEGKKEVVVEFKKWLKEKELNLNEESQSD